MREPCFLPEEPSTLGRRWSRMAGQRAGVRRTDLSQRGRSQAERGIFQTLQVPGGGRVGRADSHRPRSEDSLVCRKQSLMAAVWVGWPPNGQALPEHSWVGGIPERQGTSRKHPLPDAELCPGPHGQDEELQLQALQRPLATRDRDWALLSWLG